MTDGLINREHLQLSIIINHFIILREINPSIKGIYAAK